MKVTKSALGLAATAIAYQFAVADVAWAQSGPNSEGPANDANEIVVTALKRSESLQEVPASITAMTGDMLAQRGISDIRDLSKAVPNLIWGEHFGTTLITIRGAGSNVDSGATEPTVAFYVDGIYLPRSDMATFRAVDLERVEVLRGPQGTLYGRNAAGGAINFISQAPSAEFEGKIEGSTGSRDAWGINGYLSGSIAPGLKVRVSGGREKQDGYVTVLNTGQKLNGVNTTFGRLALTFEPAKGITNDVSIRYERNTAAVAYQQPVAPLVFPSSTFTTEPNKLLADNPYSGKRETFIASNVLTAEISDNVTLKSLTGYIDHNSHAEVDADGSLVPFQFVPDFERTSESFSQEFNLVGQSGKLDWIVGLFYFHENYRGVLPVEIQAGLAPALGVPVGSTISLGQTAKISNIAAFTDLTYHVSDAFSVNLGLRYNHEDNKYAEIWSFLPVAGEIVGLFSKKSSKVLPKIALNYDFSPNVHTYLQWSKGYKSGGVNLPAGSGEILPLYAPENIGAFEGGVKSQFFDRTVTLNVSSWFYKYNGLQITKDRPPATTLVLNADAELYGIEGELRYSPSRSFDISVAPTWQHAVFKDFSTFNTPTNADVDLDGSPLPRAPKFSVNAGIGGRFDLGGTLLSSLRLDANLVYNSSTVLRFQNQEASERQKAYTVVNFSAALSDASEKTQLSLFLNNAFGTKYKQQVLNFGLGYFGNFGPPATWGARLSRKF